MDRLLEPFFRLARDQPGVLAVASRCVTRRGQRTVSFGDLEAHSREWMRRLGDDPRPLAVAVGNGPEFLEIFLAAWRLGVPAIAMDASGSSEKRRELCRHLGVARLAERVGAAIEVTSIDVQATEAPQGTRLVKLTSGSTGQPLAACFDEESLCRGIGQIAEGMDITAADKVLMALPLSHSYGFDNGLLSLFVLGTPLILEPSVFPADLQRALATTEATILPLVPPLVRSLSAAPWGPTNLRLVLCAGGVLPTASAREFHAASGHHVHNFYGSTETGGICFERRPGDPGAEGTVGEPLPGVELSFDEIGRVSVDSAANLIGRFGQTAKPCRASIRTGDLGHVAADGRLHLTGRVANLLNIGGRKIAAVEVESALRELDGVEEAAVVGIPDEVRGDRAVAFLVADRWPIAWRSLPTRLRPRELRRVESLPHNARGKLDRQALKSMAVQPPDGRREVMAETERKTGLVANLSAS